jgi:hypothetical protein
MSCVLDLMKALELCCERTQGILGDKMSHTHTHTYTHTYAHTQVWWMVVLMVLVSLTLAMSKLCGN